MTLQLAPMTRESLASSIYRALRYNLMTGALKPGEVLTLRAISERLGVSQTPVRESLLQLVSERLLVMTPGKSVCVPVLDKVALQELRDIRLALESMALERAMGHIQPGDIDQLEALHRDVVKYKASEDREGTLRSNYEFHFALYGIARMPELLAIIEGLWARSGPTQSYLYQAPFFHTETAHPHEQLLQALRLSDTRLALDALRHDIRAHGAALMQRMPT